ncbi:Dockerin type I repeat protein [Crateriforma conspicua]|uniref:Dockerin type I repeat protein n=1 Tax=Crateriforma conspicua TaxID=2527996 RepID=A0A5C6FTV7_9PLAN|nr:Dockerin type I repeat protein [Crateriforma conspicua]
MSRRQTTRRRLRLERLSNRRVLAAITGVVFDDIDHSFQRGDGENPLPQRLVFLDANENGDYDAGESFALTDAQGRFEFSDLDPGSYAVRLFDGAASQSQHFPAQLTATANQFALSGLDSLHGDGQRIIGVDGTELVIADLNGAGVSRLGVGAALGDAATLSSERTLVVGAGADAGELFIANHQDQSIDTLDVGNAAEGQTRTWHKVAVDGDGRGLAIATVEESGESSTVVHSIDATDPGNISLSSTQQVVAADSQFVSSRSGPRSVLVTPGEDGVAVELWSNLTASPIPTTATEISGAGDVLDFDDAAGLLLLRDTSGGVTVVDVNNQFAPLFQFDDLAGPVRLDPARELLWAFSPIDSTLKVLELGGGNQIAQLPVEATSVGAISSFLPGRIDPSSGIESLALVGAAGIAEVKLQSPTAHRVTLTSDEAETRVGFGVRLVGSNQSPALANVPGLQTPEDQNLMVPAATIGSAIEDGDGDRVVVLPGPPSDHSDVTVNPDGSLIYRPVMDFNGNDVLQLILADGRSVTPIQIPVVVTSVPDDPTGVTIHLPSVAESVLIGSVLGSIDVHDPDGQDHTIQISDPRFGEIDGDIIFAGGQLDFEEEPIIQMELSIQDPDTQTVLTEQVTVSLIDANDPITGITPDRAFVSENAFGDIVAELIVEDQDVEQFYELSVDDERFTIEETHLRLAPGVALDYEAEKEVTVNVTAFDAFNDDRFTQAVTVVVRDEVEAPSDMTLDGDTVIEYVPGDVVGVLAIDGVTRPNGYSFGVDDPSFEVVAGTLKLLPGSWVVRSDTPEIQVEITAQNDNAAIAPLVRSFVVTVLANDRPFHNEDQPLDVNGNDDITAQDALLVINYLNTYGPGPVGEGNPAMSYDVNGDGMVTALDVLLIVNRLNRGELVSTGGNNGGGQAEGEGTETDPPAEPKAFQMAQPKPASSSMAIDHPQAVDIAIRNHNDDDDDELDPWLDLLSNETV